MSERQRLLELALESLENRKKALDEEIAAITRELRGHGRAITPEVKAKAAGVASRKSGSRFSREERVRRSQRMKAYWENWRKQKGRQK